MRLYFGLCINRSDLPFRDWCGEPDGGLDDVAPQGLHAGVGAFLIVLHEAAKTGDVGDMMAARPRCPIVTPVCRGTAW